MPAKAADFLSKTRRGDPPSAVVVYGEESFLRRQARVAIREWVIDGEPSDFNYAVFEDPKTPLSDVLDLLSTPSFLGDRRLVVVEGADAFVSEHREALERYLNQPADGVLVLDVSKWSAATRLYKLVESRYLAIECTPPKAWHVGAWCVHWAQSRYGKKLGKGDAEWLVELVGTELGQLDQELAKLANYVDSAATITRAAITEIVADSAAQNVFKILDQVLDGDLAGGLKVLDQQLTAGEDVHRLLGALTSQLQRLAQASRRIAEGASMEQAMTDAGIMKFFQDKGAEQLRRIGRQRLEGLYHLLLRTDLSLKGGSGFGQRFVIERLLFSLGRTGV